MLAGGLLWKALPAGPDSATSQCLRGNRADKCASNQARLWAAIALPHFQAAVCFSTLAACPNGYENTCFSDGFSGRCRAQTFQQ